MNIPRLTLVALALATLIHIKLKTGREQSPQLIYTKSRLLDDAVFRREFEN